MNTKTIRHCRNCGSSDKVESTHYNYSKCLVCGSSDTQHKLQTQTRQEGRQDRVAAMRLSATAVADSAARYEQALNKFDDVLSELGELLEAVKDLRG